MGQTGDADELLEVVGNELRAVVGDDPRDLAMVRVRFGYPRLTVLLKREGWPVGKKLLYRLYRELPADAHQEAMQASVHKSFRISNL